MASKQLLRKVYGKRTYTKTDLIAVVLQARPRTTDQTVIDVVQLVFGGERMSLGTLAVLKHRVKSHTSVKMKDKRKR